MRRFSVAPSAFSMVVARALNFSDRCFSVGRHAFVYAVAIRAVLFDCLAPLLPR